MDGELARLEREARQDAADLEVLGRLAQARERAGWRHGGRTLGEWARTLARRPSAARAEDLEALGPALVVPLLERFHAAGERLRAAGAMDEQEVWLWTGRRPHAASALRERVVAVLARLGPEALAALPALAAALDDFSVCHNAAGAQWAEQVHLCARAADALVGLGPAARAPLSAAARSTRVCRRFFEPFAPPEGDAITLGEVARAGLARLRTGTPRQGVLEDSRRRHDPAGPKA